MSAPSKISLPYTYYLNKLTLWISIIGGVTIDVLKTLHALCRVAGIRYAILGGAACMALGSTRATQDVDIVVATGPESGQDIDSKIRTLVGLSGGRFSAHTDQYGIPHFRLDGIEVEIFDPTVWPHRPQYRQFLSNNGSIYIGDKDEGYVVVAPPLLLREKLITFGERKNRPSSDLQDIQFLMWYCSGFGYTIDLRGNDTISASARAGLLEFANTGGQVYPGVVIQ
ncbi:uncharacterized protein FOMMEDRAFT_81035 [Fomitiporia mediterranea MF3/22]|uniref:uncharacterized protein n=1 Tax=Fomitiporia mediterranea (strain MF3/22) TaxID=694068 RepID=UPI00044079A1|nr:uncharacterized protein FOMMEDRAFT_81035 [Fomitiporia mediterranea MF3/22]EJD04955.1 hypothetical protein FOMMEDRAFT_81035 [Fomitiporia mediterranea MF3/22]